MSVVNWTFVAPFLATPRNYGEVLSKLAGFAFYEAYLITFILRNEPEIDRILRSAETYIGLGPAISSIVGSTLNIAGFVIAVFCAILSSSIHLHDRISDLFRIRLRFDCKKILFPLAQLVGSYLTGPQQEVTYRQRDRLMREIFYRYASSRADKPLVDKHDIEHALAAWSWFWVWIEAIFFLGIASIVAVIYDAKSLVTGFLIGISILVGLALLQYARLGRYARVQIETIASDTAASQAVRAQFDAL